MDTGDPIGRDFDAVRSDFNSLRFTSLVSANSSTLCRAHAGQIRRTTSRKSAGAC